MEFQEPQKYIHFAFEGKKKDPSETYLGLCTNSYINFTKFQNGKEMDYKILIPHFHLIQIEKKNKIQNEGQTDQYECLTTTRPRVSRYHLRITRMHRSIH